MLLWWTGSALFTVGGAWVVTDRALTTAYPLARGGPNIGAGALLLLAWALAVIGAVLLLVSGPGLVAALADSHRSHPARRADRPNGPAAVPRTGSVRLPRPESQARTADQDHLPTAFLAVPAAVDVVVLLAVAAAYAVLPGDRGHDGGLAGVNGQTGVTVDAAGHPVAVLEVCYGAVDTVTAYGPNRGDQPNELLAELHTPTPLTAPGQVALLDPPAPWSGAPAVLPWQGQPFAIIAGSTSGSELRQVDVSAATLVGLDPGTVVYSDIDPTSQQVLVQRRVPRAGFHAVACASR